MTAIIFCASLSEYDQVLREDESQNRMVESLTLFEQITNTTWFEKIPFILFLNKMDLFQEKIKVVPLAKFYSDYQGSIFFCPN